ncbi:MAG: DNA-deoxyinosine glycosylase [Eubacteriales bacterium]|nr:DNA-deoxyinosine glycosylase [Eubacteriales bacterium]
MDYTHVRHTFAPIYDETSRVLILGSFPSVKSREQQFYYGHPQNRFWKVIAAVCEEEVPQTIEEKRGLLLRNHIAVWDVIAECDIIGSGDSSIKNVIPNDLTEILKNAQIRQICANGAKADALFKKYDSRVLGRNCVRLPSTSPANAAWGVEKLTESWKAILQEPLQETE